MLALLPGLHGTGDLFGPLLAVLPKGLRTRVLEYPTDRCRSYEHHLRRVEKELAGEGEIVLFAESFSGPLAVRYAAANPERVRALVLCGSFITAPVPRILCFLAPLPILACCPLPGFGIRAFLGGSGASMELVGATRRAIRRVRPHVLAHRVMQVAWLDAREALRECRVPILCLAGTRDRLVGARSIRRIGWIRPDVAVRRIEGPHLLLQSRPEEVWGHVREFVGMG